LGAPLAPAAVAGRARLFDDRAAAVAERARLLQREEPLRRRDDTGAFALGARHPCRPGCGPRAVARVARELELDRDGHLHALQGVLERDVHLGLDVVAALAALLLLLRAPAAAVEQPAEDVAEVEVGEVVRRAAGAEPGRAAVRRAEAVVLLALL